VDYLKFTQEFNHQFPGFETDVHGLAYDADDSGQRHYYVDCIREDAIDA
jgi:arginine/lysine/ornithine decarboxylase